MKRCPQCNRVEADDALGFCRVDGATLVTGPLTDSENTTAIFDSGAASSESTTRSFAPQTNEGVSRSTGPTTTLPSRQLHSQTRPLAKSTRAKILVAVGAVIVAALSVTAYFFLTRTRANNAISSVAVLPFVDRSGNTDSEYITDGIAESLIYRLSQLPNLKVSPTSAVMRYKGKEVDVQKIAAELGVDAVMSGRMVERGENIMISVELIDARTNRLLWGEQFERKMSDLMSVQREIASAVSQKLQLKISGAETGTSKRYTTDNDAYRHYLKGRFYWNKRTAESVDKAIDQFTTAVQKDPEFALAYAGLADCYAILSVFVGRKWQENVPLARSNALKATSLDETLAEPHATLGLIHHFEWRTAEAEAEFRRAIDLNPNYATARHWYALFLRAVGRNDEAYDQMNRANEIDPISLVVLQNIAEVQIARGNPEEAVAICRKLLDLEPSFWAGHNTLAIAYIKQQRYDEALAEAQKVVELTKRGNDSLALLAHVYGRMGRRAQAESVIKELQGKYTKQDADARDLAVAYAGLDQRDQVFAWLEKSYQEHSLAMAVLRTEALLDPVKSDPRWNELLKRVGV
jgi:TolB-like protein/Tfp pilus assembly protein PilF